MSFFRKLARRKAPLPLPGPSSQEGATDLATSDDIATHGPLTEFPPTEGQRPTAETEDGVSDRSGHRYDRVQIGGESRNHLGDVYNRHVTYNYGAMFPPSENTEKQGEDDDARCRETARLGAERRLEEEQRISSEHQRLDFLQALRFDGMDSREATIGLAHTDSCTWIVEAPEYLKWRDKCCLPEHHGVLWIKGNPGCGKSTLMKYALNIAQQRDDGDIIASFFFNARGQPFEKSAKGMYRSLLHQVLSKLRHLYSDRIHVKQQDWSIEMLETILQETVLVFKSHEHLVLYIDALDECVQEEVRDVVGHFEELVDLAVSRGLRFSICFSSRHYPQITMHKFEELQLDKRIEHIEDISKYVHSNISRMSIPLSAKIKIEADIKRRSSGIFLWAVLVIKILKEKRDDGAPLSELMSSLAAVPEKLGSLFTNILAQSEESTTTAFQWIPYSEWSLSWQELYFAIKTNNNQVSTGEWDIDDADIETIQRFVMRSTRGLVEEVANSAGFGRIQFIHESVREHLLQGGLASLTMGDPRLIEGSAHAQIARCCLSYIQLDSSKYLQYFDPHRSLSWFSSERFPLHSYTKFYLLVHTERAYSAGALSLTFLSELPLRLLICSRNISSFPKLAFSESATLLFLILHKGHFVLAEALLANCSKTEKPGIVTFGTTAHSLVTFDINTRCKEDCGGVLGLVASYGHIQLVRKLLHLGAEVVPSDRDVCNPLIPAASWGSKDVVELLLQHGADVNVVSDSVPPESALMVAVREDNYDIASVLLAHGADVHYRSEFRTALDLAMSDRNFEMIKLLWNAHFPKSKWDRTLLACASKTEEHRYDAVTVHGITYRTGNERNSGYETGSDDSSKTFFISDNSDESGRSITSIQTV